MACPGPNINGEWLCNDLGCDVGGIHTTCKKAFRLARLKDDSSNT